MTAPSIQLSTLELLRTARHWVDLAIARLEAERELVQADAEATAMLGETADNDSER
jgi:hypothetical protein